MASELRTQWTSEGAWCPTELPYGASLPFVGPDGEETAGNGICFQLCAHLAAFHKAPRCGYQSRVGAEWVETLCPPELTASFAARVPTRRAGNAAMDMYSHSFEPEVHEELAQQAGREEAPAWTRWGWKWLRDRALWQLSLQRQETPHASMAWFVREYAALNARLVSVAPALAGLGIEGVAAASAPAPPAR